MRASCGRVSDKTHQDQQTSVICCCRWDHFGFYLSAHLQAVFLQCGLGHHVAFCEFKGKLYANRFAADEFYYNESVARIGMNILDVVSLQNIVTNQMKLCFYSARQTENNATYFCISEMNRNCRLECACSKGPRMVRPKPNSRCRVQGVGPTVRTSS